MTTPPLRSARRRRQKREALALANEIRFKRATLKADLKTGRTTLAQVLQANEPYVQTMPIAKLLRATPGLGRVKTDQALRALNLSPSVRLKHVSMQRRKDLLVWVDGHFPTVEVTL